MSATRSSIGCSRRDSRGVDRGERLGVTDMTHIEIDRLLSCTVDELIALVQPMSADNCEQYARAILGRIGGPSLEQVIMRIIETAVQKDGAHPPTNSDAYYFA